MAENIENKQTFEEYIIELVNKIEIIDTIPQETLEVSQEIIQNFNNLQEFYSIGALKLCLDADINPKANNNKTLLRIIREELLKAKYFRIYLPCLKLFKLNNELVENFIE